MQALLLLMLFCVTCCLSVVSFYFNPFQILFQGRAKFLDYERRVFRPPASTGSSSYKNRIDNRSVSSSSVNNTPNRKRKLPPPGYDINYDARSFGFNPHFENDIQYNRRSIVITDNTVYIPFAPRYNDNFLPDRHESNYRLPRLSIREIDDEVSINDDRQFPPNYQSSAEDDRNYSSSYSPRADNRRNFRSNYRHKGYPRYDLDYM